MPAQNNSMVSFSFDSLVWKISADAQNNILALELRDHDSRSVDFAAIDLKSNKILWQGVKLEETWWLGLNTCYHGRIYLHSYKDPQNPEHKDIFALDARTGKIAWKDTEKTFYLISEKQLIAMQGDEDNRKYIGLDPATGKTLIELSLKDVFKIASGKKVPESEKIRNPFHFSAEHPYFSKISDFVKEITGEQAVIAADYLENGEQVIISFYLYSTDGMSNHIILVDENGVIIFRACLAAQIKGIGFDTFFVFENVLIFVKEKKELIFLKIS
jgi:outer membrane protein assembly factor BamB